MENTKLAAGRMLATATKAPHAPDIGVPTGAPIRIMATPKNPEVRAPWDRSPMVRALALTDNEFDDLDFFAHLESERWDTGYVTAMQHRVRTILEREGIAI